MSKTLNLSEHLLERGRFLQGLGRTRDAMRVFGRLAGLRDLPAPMAEETQIRLAEMRLRIQEMRALFVESLRVRGVPGDFGFIAQQRGMFSYSGLSTESVQRLRDDFSIYVVDSGRICVAAMNRNNMPRICDAIAAVLA